MRKRRRRHPPFPLFYQTNTKNFLIITQDEEDDDGDFKVHKKSDKQIVGGKVLDTFEDETLSCRDCAEDFVFTSGEQEFYASKGWENKPTRCEACKTAKKARFGEDKPKCYAYERGECTRGENCRFSHGSEPTYGGRRRRRAAALRCATRIKEASAPEAIRASSRTKKAEVAVPDRRREVAVAVAAVVASALRF